MKIDQLQKWVKKLPMEDYIDLVLFYSRLCAVCSKLDKEDKM